MKARRNIDSLAALLFGSTLACLAACGSSASDTANAAAAAGAAGSGAAGSAGSPASAGSAGSAGANGSGGAVGSAGSNAGNAGASGSASGSAGSAGSSGGAGSSGAAGGDAGVPCALATFQTDCPARACNLVSGCEQGVCQYTPLTVCVSRSANGTFSPGIADVTVGALTLHGNLAAFRAADGPLCKGTTCLTGGLLP